MFKPEMLFISLFCVILCTVWGQENRITLFVPPDQVLNFRKNGETCSNAHGVDQTAIRKLMAGTIPQDKSHKQFVLCILLKSSYMNEDGHLNIEEVSKVIPINGTQDEARRIYEECDKISLEDAVETSFEIARCYHKRFILTIKKPEA